MARGADRLEVLCELNRRLATLTDLDELLRYATRRARELFDADGCALSLFDRRRRKLYVSAVGGDGSNQASATSLDEATISVPLRTRCGTIGVVEVVEAGQGRFTTDNFKRLEALASDIAVAYEQVVLYERVASEAIESRRMGMVAGLGVAALGLVLLLGAIFVLEAQALPLSELPTRPGMWPGLIFTLAGVVLAGVYRSSGHAKPVEGPADRPEGPRLTRSEGKRCPAWETRIRDERAA